MMTHMCAGSVLQTRRQDATNFIPRAWPRTAAVAERGWSAKDVRDISDAQARLHEWRCKLIARGINAEPIGSAAFPILWLLLP